MILCGCNKILVKPINKPSKEVLVKPINKPSKEIHQIEDKIIKLINGHSPIISDHSTWLIYNDETGAYEDTGIVVTGLETDPTVPDWAKQPVKPSYDCTEIGAINADNALTLKEIDDLFGGVIDG